MTLGKIGVSIVVVICGLLFIYSWYPFPYTWYWLVMALVIGGISCLIASNQESYTLSSVVVAIPLIAIGAGTYYGLPIVCGTATTALVGIGTMNAVCECRKT